MSDYKCIRSFKSSQNNKAYYVCSKISSSEYNGLPYSDRSNFQKVDEDDTPYGSSGYSSSSDSSWMSSSSDSSSSSWDSGSSSDSSSDFGGFGGGDGGGAGAGGDY